MLRKTKARRIRHLQTVMKDKLELTSAGLTYTGIAGSNGNAEDNDKTVEQKKARIGGRRHRMASLPVSCNRAISKKLWVMFALAFIRAAEVRKQRGNKTQEKERCG